jgi:pimeloyl-ACP methyl ester carboxylesterase
MSAKYRWWGDVYAPAQCLCGEAYSSGRRRPSIGHNPRIRAQASASGRRPGHYQAFLNLLRHAYLWNAAREHYGDIEVPVLVVYGDHDWSRPDERQRTVAAIPMAKIETVPDGGHFLSLDRPQRLAEMIMSFAKG